MVTDVELALPWPLHKGQFLEARIRRVSQFVGRTHNKSLFNGRLPASACAGLGFCLIGLGSGASALAHYLDSCRPEFVCLFLSRLVSWLGLYSCVVSFFFRNFESYSSLSTVLPLLQPLDSDLTTDLVFYGPSD